jgi:hypothetical protein
MSKSGSTNFCRTVSLVSGLLSSFKTRSQHLFDKDLMTESHAMYLLYSHNFSAHKPTFVIFLTALNEPPNFQRTINMDSPIEFNIEHIHDYTQGLCLAKPKKLDGSLFAKLRHNKAKVYTYLYGVKVLQKRKVKDAMCNFEFLVLKTSRTIHDALVELDEHLVGVVVDNCESWFSDALDKNIIEEYFKKSVNFLKNGIVVKLKVQEQNDSEIQLDETIDILLCCKGLRFYKQMIIPEWEVIYTRPASHDAFDIDVSQAESMFLETNDDELPLDDDELTMFDAIHTLKKDMGEVITSKKKRFQAELEKVSEIEEMLGTCCAVEDINNLAEHIL